MSFDLHLNDLRTVVTGGTLGLGAAGSEYRIDGGTVPTV